MAPLTIILGILLLLLFLLLRNTRRSRRFQSFSLFESSLDDEPISEDVHKSFTFWAGGLAGVVSAALTHQLDVFKTLRQVGKPLPTDLSHMFIGIFMGSFAQGFRFAVTLVLNMTLQKHLDSCVKAASKRKGCCSWLLPFLVSMFAAGIGEFLANPPVVIKNYQIVHQDSIADACTHLWQQGGLPRFFNGVGMGVLRKSLANGIVLQTMVPTKRLLELIFPHFSKSKVSLSFVAGSLTGSLAEVMTNFPDQVKTMTQAGVPLLEALTIASQHPFRGAFWAGIRKGIIRGINWGGLAFFMAIFEQVYRLTRRKDCTSSMRRQQTLEDALDAEMTFVRAVSVFAEETQS